MILSKDTNPNIYVHFKKKSGHNSSSQMHKKAPPNTQTKWW